MSTLGKMACGLVMLAVPGLLAEQRFVSTPDAYAQAATESKLVVLHFIVDPNNNHVISAYPIPE